MKRNPISRELPFTIQNKTTTIDGAGDPVTSWGDGIQIWCSISPMSEREVLALGGQLNDYWFKAMTRFNSNVNQTARLFRTNTGEYYNIESVRDPVGDRMYLELKIRTMTSSELGAN